MYKLLLIFLFCIINLNASNYQALLFNGNCITCHHKTQSISAPSLQNIQNTYKNAFPLKKDFIRYMSIWVKHPNAQTSLMHHAIEKYELMPELGFDSEALKEISEYIYNMKFK